MRTEPRTSMTLPLLGGTAAVLAFFAGFGGWAAMAPLAGAAVAPAVVTPDGSRRTIQHLEGGIVGRILVREGDRIAQGQLLIELDPIRARSEHAMLLAEWRALAAAEARLAAEQLGAETIGFPDDLIQSRSESAVARVLADEQERFESRRRALADQEAVLLDRAAQSEAEITGHQDEIKSADRQLVLIGEESEGVRTLLEKGLERKPRYLALERSRVQIEGSQAAATAAIARARQMIGEAQQQIMLLKSQRADDVAKELADTRRQLAEIREKLAAAADKLTRTMITAPVAGTVIDLKIKTPGGVIAPGEAILDIVPEADALMLDARVAPTDIDEVHAGLTAQVHLLAYQSRTMPRIEGVVREVSADRLTDPLSQQPYYAARVAVDPATLPTDMRLAAGMPADVMIVTGERTFLDYLLEPIRDTLRRGARES